ncbi:iron ABC transporter permease [soil metagenome]
MTILLGLLAPASPEWEHLRSTVLSGYIANTLILCVATGVMSLAFGVPSAYLVSTCAFPGRRIFEWALILPLALPTYIAAYAYSYAMEWSIPVQIWVRDHLGADAQHWAEVVFVYGLLSTLLAAVLFPYVYLAARAAFSRQVGASALEAARTLGASASRTFFRVAVPMARPAIVAGLALVFMEVLNDYGAVKFFAIGTLTTGIFKSWMSIGDLPSAIRLSGIVMVIVLAVIVAERVARGRARFDQPAGASRPLSRRRLGGAGAAGAVFCCLLPLALGFLLPVGRLGLLVIESRPDLSRFRFGELLANSVLLAGGTAVLLVSAATVMAYAGRLYRQPLVLGLSRLALLGYAVPGAVIAIGVIVPFAKVGIGFGLAAVVFAYFCRFLAVGYAPVEGGMAKVCSNLDEAARTLGHRPLATLFRINLPLLRPVLTAAGILVFVDLLKELPLTLILRPFNFDTLATRAFDLAEEGRIADCAVPALVVIAAGAAAGILLNRQMR